MLALFTSYSKYKTYFSALPDTGVDESLLHGPDPICEGAVQGKVGDYGNGGPAFRGLETVFVVEGEGGGGDEDGGVSEGELDVGVPVVLAEFQRVEVVLEGVVGGIFAVWQMLGWEVVRVLNQTHRRHCRGIFSSRRTWWMDFCCC